MFPWVFFLLVGVSFVFVQIRAKAESFDGLDPYISKVESGGDWLCGKNRGFFRLIVQTTQVPQADGSESVVDKAYLQWIQVGFMSRVDKVIYTTPVPEATRILSRITETSSFVQGKDKVCQIYLTLTPWESAQSLLVITPKCDFTYELVELPKPQ